MNRWIAVFGLGIVIAACGGAADEPIEEEPVAEEERIPVVADSIIEREVAARIEADPRLGAEEIEIAVHSRDQEVTLVGSVPTRLEQSIAREVAISAPGVKRVWLDSLVVEADAGAGATATEGT